MYKCKISSLKRMLNSNSALSMNSYNTMSQIIRYFYIAAVQLFRNNMESRIFYLTLFMRQELKLEVK